MSLSVDDELRRLLTTVAGKCGERTASKTIRWALRKVIEPDPSKTLGLEIIQWAKSLKFLSRKEQHEMNMLVAKMYKQVQ